MLKVTASFALLLFATATTAAQESPAPAAGTTVFQGGPAAVGADDIKLKSSSDVVDPSAEPQKADAPAAGASNPSPSQKPAAKRAAVRHHSIVTREKARLGYPSYAAPM